MYIYIYVQLPRHYHHHTDRPTDQQFYPRCRLLIVLSSSSLSFSLSSSLPLLVHGCIIIIIAPNVHDSINKSYKTWRDCKLSLSLILSLSTTLFLIMRPIPLVFFKTRSFSNLFLMTFQRQDLLPYASAVRWYNNSQQLKVCVMVLWGIKY